MSETNETRDGDMKDNRSDTINRPAYYQSGGAGCDRCGAPIECIQISEQFSFTRGNVIKYIWRAGFKRDELQDLKKARWYLDREIKQLERSRQAERSHTCRK